MNRPVTARIACALRAPGEGPAELIVLAAAGIFAVLACAAFLNFVFGK